MAGWGLCGVLGAALALGVRNAGRLSLAATCGLAGIAYGALLNFSLMATYGGDLSLERFGVLEARAVPFDVAHVAGNVVFALIAGPAMVRMLVRFRERFEWGAAGRGAAAPAAAAAWPRPARRRHRRAAARRPRRSARWRRPAPRRRRRPRRQLAASRCRTATAASAPRPSDDSGAEMTAWAMLGLEAAGRNPLDVATRRPHPGRLPARARSTS